METLPPLLLGPVWVSEVETLLSCALFMGKSSFYLRDVLPIKIPDNEKKSKSKNGIGIYPYGS